MTKLKASEINERAKAQAIEYFKDGLENSGAQQIGASTYAIMTIVDGMEIYVTVDFTKKNHVETKNSLPFDIDEAVAEWNLTIANRLAKETEAAKAKAAKIAKDEKRRAEAEAKKKAAAATVAASETVAE